MTAPPLILTLELAPDVQEWAQHMRTQYFPPDKNIVPAHITLFHALPEERRPQLETALVLPACQPVVRIEAPYLLGRGVAYRISCPTIAALRTEIVKAVSTEHLTKQDRAPWRPHLTIQNKASPQHARDLLNFLSASHDTPINTTAEALLLWQYLGGPWRLIERFPFCSSRASLHAPSPQ